MWQQCVVVWIERDVAWCRRGGAEGSVRVVVGGLVCRVEVGVQEVCGVARQLAVVT